MGTRSSSRERDARKAIPQLLDRLANRLFDAGAEPAGPRFEASQGIGDAVRTGDIARPTTRCVTAVAEQIDRTVGMGPRRAGRRLGFRAPDAGGDAEDPKPAAVASETFVRDCRRLTDPGRAQAVLAGILGVARDAEVLAEKYENALAALPADLVRGPVRERLVDGGRRRYHAGWKRSLVAMRSERYFRMLDGLEALVSAEQPQSDGGAEPDQVTVDGAYARVRKAAKKADRAAADDTVSVTDADEALHAIRKRAKQLRYTAAALGEDQVADEAKSIQSLLGDHQDSVVSRTHLSDEALTAHGAGEDTFTYGVLYQLESEVATRSEEQLGRALKGLKKAVRSAG